LHRFERRRHILDGRRGRAFDPRQYYREAAVRARAGRKVRFLLRQMQPVVLITPRWSRAHRFLDDIAVDLAVGTPPLRCRTLSLVPLQGRTVHESWTWLVHAMSEFCELRLAGPVAQAVSRDGFRHVMAGLFERSARGPRKALLVHGLEHLHVEARDDMFRVFEEHVRTAGDGRSINLLVAGAVDAPSFTLKGARRIVLPDFAREEAIEALVEYVGPQARGVLEPIVDLVGGVPALLDALGMMAENGGQLVGDRDQLFRSLGPLADEVRGAVAIASAVDGLATRLERVALQGPVPVDPQWDRLLERAGLVQVATGHVGKVTVRAPLFAQLVT
jgi:hypothetical protein